MVSAMRAPEKQPRDPSEKEGSQNTHLCEERTTRKYMLLGAYRGSLTQLWLWGGRPVKTTGVKLRMESLRSVTGVFMSVPKVNQWQRIPTGFPFSNPKRS